jgi:hypothetical protein
VELPIESWIADHERGRQALGGAALAPLDRSQVQGSARREDNGTVLDKKAASPVIVKRGERSTDQETIWDYD